MAVNGPTTGLKMVDPNTGLSQDLGTRYVSKDYLLDVYPNLVPGRTAPGLWSWGYNLYGQVGNNVAGTSASSPVVIGALVNWKQVSSGWYHAAAVKTDGTLWAWGRNLHGQLGLGDANHRSSPVQVGALTNWKMVSAGQYHIAAIKTDGTLWTWGRNNGYGYLGLNDVAHRSSPVQVGALTNWKVVSCGVYHCAGIKTDGSLWTWGYNSLGQVGNNTSLSVSSPVQVGSLTNWKVVGGGGYHTLAIKSDNTLWSWGYNLYGQLGLGDATHRSSPVQIGALTNWRYTTTGGQYATGAIKTDGTLWTWGSGGNGTLGLGNTTTTSSPVQVGLLTNWKQIAFQSGGFISLKTDGTIWASGANGSGGLGLGDIVHRSSPVQVGSLTNWKQVSAGDLFISAIRDGYI